MKNALVRKELENIEAQNIRVEIAECTEQGFRSISLDVAGDFDDVITVKYESLEDDQEVILEDWIKEATKLKTYLKKYFNVEKDINIYTI